MSRISVPRGVSLASHVIMIVSLMAPAGCGKRAKKPAEQAPLEAAEPAESDSARIKMTNLPGVVMPLPPPVELPKLQSFKLAGAGKGKLRVYRYEPDGQTRELVVSARVQVRELINGSFSESVSLPELRYGLALGPAGEPGSTGLVMNVRGLVAELGEPSQSDPVQAANARRVGADFLARFREHVERRRATAIFDERGLLGELTLVPGSAGSAGGSDPGVSARHEMQQILLESVVPLPAEAIGKGARWEVRMLMRRGPGIVTHSGVYELIGVDKDRLRVAVTLTQLAERQRVPTTGMQGALAAELTALFWQARGELEIMTGSLTPIAGHLDVELRVHTRAIGRSQELDFFIESLGKVELGSAAP